MFRIFSALLFVAAIYPLALVMQLSIDWLYGDAQFLQLYFYDSRRRLLLLFLTGWWGSAGWSISAFAFLAGSFYLARRKLERPMTVLFVVWLALLLIGAVLGSPRFLLFIGLTAFLSFCSWWILLALLSSQGRRQV